MPRSQQTDDAMSMVRSLILKNPKNTVLDIGIGSDWKWGRLLHGQVAQIDGIEAWLPNMAGAGDFYDNLTHADVSVVEIAPRDVAILGDVLEHLTHQDALELVDRLQNKVGEIFLIIPISVCEQNGFLLGNPYETHLYHWSDKEIRALGFEPLHIGVNDNHLVAIGTYVWRRK